MKLREQLLIIFVKSPVAGKVKTRLAAEIGEEEACQVYRQLLTDIHEVAINLSVEKVVYYDGRIENDDIWEEEYFGKELQRGKDIGVRMANAFRDSFWKGYQKVILIGSDINGLTKGIIEGGFESLNDHDVVIGPANDGGYYMVGMKRLHVDLFQGIRWSTPSVLEETLNNAKAMSLKTMLLKELIDIDVMSDLVQLPHLVEFIRKNKNESEF